MNGKFKDKYRIDSNRLQKWNYSWNGAYFITICTHSKALYFGNIANVKMQLSEVGILANSLWHELKDHSNNVELGEFVVMPNHVHGILILNGLNTVPTEQQTRFQNQGKNTISSIIGGYKSAVTKYAHLLGFDFAWQSRFYDQIIRNERAYQNISQYIIDNPKKWNADKFNPNPQ